MVTHLIPLCIQPLLVNAPRTCSNRVSRYMRVLNEGLSAGTKDWCFETRIWTVKGWWPCISSSFWQCHHKPYPTSGSGVVATKGVCFFCTCVGCFRFWMLEFKVLLRLPCATQSLLIKFETLRVAGWSMGLKFDVQLLAYIRKGQTFQHMLIFPVRPQLHPLETGPWTLFQAPGPGFLGSVPRGAVRVARVTVLGSNRFGWNLEPLEPKPLSG